MDNKKEYEVDISLKKLELGSLKRLEWCVTQKSMLMGDWKGYADGSLKRLWWWVMDDWKDYDDGWLKRLYWHVADGWLKRLCWRIPKKSMMMGHWKGYDDVW
jgi:hypothetical protein